MWREFYRESALKSQNTEYPGGGGGETYRDHDIEVGRGGIKIIPGRWKSRNKAWSGG